MTEEAERVAAERGLQWPTVTIYFRIIAAIERKLEQS